MTVISTLRVKMTDLMPGVPIAALDERCVIIFVFILIYLTQLDFYAPGLRFFMHKFENK